MVTPRLRELSLEIRDLLKERHDWLKRWDKRYQAARDEQTKLNQAENDRIMRG